MYSDLFAFEIDLPREKDSFGEQDTKVTITETKEPDLHVNSKNLNPCQNNK